MGDDKILLDKFLGNPFVTPSRQNATNAIISVGTKRTKNIFAPDGSKTAGNSTSQTCKCILIFNILRFHAVEIYNFKWKGTESFFTGMIRGWGIFSSERLFHSW